MIAERFQFALRNVLRQKARTTATLIAIAVGVMGLILSGGFVQDIFHQLGEATIHSQTGHLQVTKKGYREGRLKNPDLYAISAANELKDKIARDLPNAKHVMGRLTFSGLLSNGKREIGVFGEGIEPDPERALGTFMRYSSGRPLSSEDSYGLVLGQGAANSLGIKVGDRVSVVVTLAAGAINTEEFIVVGIFQTFSKDFDARAVRISLGDAQQLLDSKSIHSLVVLLNDTVDTASAQATLAATITEDNFEVLSWNKLSDFYEKTVELYDRQFGVLRLIILFMVLLSVANSINMSLFERTREFGTMLALGERSASVAQQIITESLCLGMLGGLLGVTIGCLLALAISAVGIPMPPPPNSDLGYLAAIQLDFGLVSTSGATGVAATVLASLLPAQRASKIDIVDALRHGV